MLIQNNVDKLEVERLRGLAEYKISRNLSESAFDYVVKLAVDIFNVPIAFIFTTEEYCHWIKSSIGFSLAEVPRSFSFCDHTSQTK